MIKRGSNENDNREFDFSCLTQCMSDIRQGIWNYGRSNRIFKTQLKSAHNQYYKKFIADKRQ